MRAVPFSILQVCMGNICRSPMAERLLVCAARELVEALGKAHRGRPPRPEMTSTTRGGGEEYFDRVEDEIEATVRALARAARTLIGRVSAMWIWGITGRVGCAFAPPASPAGAQRLGGFPGRHPADAAGVSIRAEWDPLRVVDRGFADGLTAS